MSDSSSWQHELLHQNCGHHHHRFELLDWLLAGGKDSAGGQMPLLIFHPSYCPNEGGSEKVVVHLQARRPPPGSGWSRFKLRSGEENETGRWLALPVAVSQILRSGAADRRREQCGVFEVDRRGSRRRGAAREYGMGEGLKTEGRKEGQTGRGSQERRPDKRLIDRIQEMR
jgi:hypothetical protein